jgi:hypothetical protein
MGNPPTGIGLLVNTGFFCRNGKETVLKSGFRHKTVPVRTNRFIGFGSR